MCSAELTNRRRASALRQKRRTVAPSTIENKCKRVFYLESRFEALGRVRPQVWRHCIESATEELLTGSSSWPLCAAKEDSPAGNSASAGVGSSSVPAPVAFDPDQPSVHPGVAGSSSAKAWWSGFDCPTFGLSEGHVDGGMLPNFGGASGTVDFESLGTAASSRREEIRRLVPCVVCARRGWSSDRFMVHLFATPSGSPYPSLIRTEHDRACSSSLPSADCGSQPALSHRQAVSWLLSPQRYYRRYAFRDKDRSSEIPLAELERSAVRDPVSGDLWLLHRKVVKFDADGNVVADQALAVCADCRDSLGAPTPRLPRYSLANDNWLGKMPHCLRSLSTGGAMLLPLCRPLIKRFNCRNDSGKFQPKDEMMKGFVGNVVAFPQANGGSLLTSLPPSQNQLVKDIVIAFTGNSVDLSKAFLKDLDVSHDDFRAAYEWLHRHNSLYAGVLFDEVESKLLDVKADCGLPSALAKCVHVQASSDSSSNTRQQGPADAVEGFGGQGDSQQEEAELPESNEWNAAVVDGDLSSDLDRQFKHVELQLRRYEYRRAKMMDEVGRARAEQSPGLRDQAVILMQSVQKLDLDAMRAGIEKVEKQLDATVPPAGLLFGARYSAASEGCTKQNLLVVPSGGEMSSMFTAGFWSAADPLCFPYGDGVFGLERDTKINFQQWVCYLLDREELEYDSIFDPPCVDRSCQDHVQKGSSSNARSFPSSSDRANMSSRSASSNVLPRWRASRDLITIMYCLWRRRRYISSTRSMARKDVFCKLFKDVGKLKPEDMYATCDLLGKGATLRDVFGNAEVCEPVKKAMRCLLLCMSSVTGTNAYRTTLRHINNGYKLCFGAPLLFLTPNIADVKNPIVKLLYEDAEVAEWRALEQDSPSMPSIQDMLRRVAADPVSQAMCFKLMVELFLFHVLGVQKHCYFSDGVISRASPSAVGSVQAYHAPTETQGRGGLHAHMQVWLQSPLDSSVLSELRSEHPSPELLQTLRKWRSQILENISSMQFDSVEEIHRQLDFSGKFGPKPVPFSQVQSQQSNCSTVKGTLEADDLAVKSPPPHAPKHPPPPTLWFHKDRCFFDPPQGPKRLRPFVPHADKEFSFAGSFFENRKKPLTGSHLTMLPRYRRKPPYKTLADGSAVMDFQESPLKEARRFAACLAEDARRCFIESHIHRCGPSCFKGAGCGGAMHRNGICRFGFYHQYHTVQFSRRYPFFKVHARSMSLCFIVDL